MSFTSLLLVVQDWNTGIFFPVKSATWCSVGCLLEVTKTLEEVRS